jgi:hypothetical protein
MAFHVLRFLFETTKWGGLIAGACAGIAGLVAFISNPVVHKQCTGTSSAQSCGDVFDGELFVDNLLIAAGAAVLGVAIAGFLVAVGVPKDKLGIEE